jgi:hypothetical protein
MDRDTAIAKIKKCLSLGKSAEPHEAGAALRQAAKLMAAFGIDDQDLDLAQMRHHAKPAPVGALSAWLSQLAHLVADAFGCGHIWSRGMKYLPDCRVRRTRDIIFFGPDGAAELACYTWDALLRQCTKARRAHIEAQPAACKTATLTARGDRFALGWVAGVRELVERMSSGGAANVKRQELLESYGRRTWPETVQVQPLRRDLGRNVRADSWCEGAEAGSKATLNQGLNNSSEPQRRLA